MAKPAIFHFPFFPNGTARVGRIVHPGFRQFLGGRSSGDVQVSSFKAPELGEP